MYNGNGVFNSLCVIRLAGFNENLSMATAINSISHKITGANQVQTARLNNESKENNQHYINCVSITRTTPIDLEVKLMDNENSTFTEKKVCKMTNTLTGHNELIAVQIHDQIETVNITMNNYKYIYIYK
jgi:hypothetical protein